MSNETKTILPIEVVSPHATPFAVAGTIETCGARADPALGVISYPHLLEVALSPRSQLGDTLWLHRKLWELLGQLADTLGIEFSSSSVNPIPASSGLDSSLDLPPAHHSTG